MAKVQPAPGLAPDRAEFKKASAYAHVRQTTSKPREFSQRVRKKIPKAPSDGVALSVFQTAMIKTLISLADKNGVASYGTSIADLCVETKLSRKGAWLVLKQLEAIGWISIERSCPEGVGHQVNAYHLNRERLNFSPRVIAGGNVSEEAGDDVSSILLQQWALEQPKTHDATPEPKIPPHVKREQAREFTDAGSDVAKALDVREPLKWAIRVAMAAWLRKPGNPHPKRPDGDGYLDRERHRLELFKGQDLLDMRDDVRAAIRDELVKRASLTARAPSSADAPTSPGIVAAAAPKIVDEWLAGERESPHDGVPRRQP